MPVIARRLRAMACTGPGGLTVHSASSMPAANRDAYAGGQFRKFTPSAVWIGNSPHPRLATATAEITGTRARTGNR